MSLFFWNSRPDFITLRCFGLNGFHCFNPCFSGTRARTEDERRDDRQLRHVSILVFLELAPGHYPTAGHRATEIEFQSLFFWNSRPDPSPDRGRGSASVEFQSLFFWNSRPDSPFDILPLVCSYCFNPCFSGTRARTARR